MTEERNRPDPDVDALVSQTYRDFAAERAPKHLDRVVLEDAANAVRPRYSRFIAWTRPMAWAATVMLSVALVLEVANTPAPEAVLFDEAKNEVDVRAPTARDDRPADLAKESVLPVSEPARKQGNGMRQKAAPVADLESDPRQAATRERAAFASDTADFEPKDRDMLQRAEEMARLQDGEERQSLPAAAAAADPAPEVAAGHSMASAAVMNAPVPDCDETVTTAPDTWQECIDQLKKAGRSDAADEQQALLAKAFPDFDPD